MRNAGIKALRVGELCVPLSLPISLPHFPTSLPLFLDLPLPLTPPSPSFPGGGEEEESCNTIKVHNYALQVW